MVVQASDGKKDLPFFKIARDADDNFITPPEDWPQINLCPDKDSSNVVVEHVCIDRELNVHVDYDLEHDGHNSGTIA